MGTRPSKKLQQTKVAKGIADARNVAMYQTGSELGAQAAEADTGIVKADWIAALKRVKTPADRSALRSGFIDVYENALRPELGSKAKVSAENRFDYLARLYGKASTSRQAKHNKKKKDKGGRPEGDGEMGGKHIPPADVALRLAAVLHYVATAQAKHAGDADMLEVLGDIAAIAGGAKQKKLPRPSKEKKIRAMIAEQLHI